MVSRNYGKLAVLSIIFVTGLLMANIMGQKVVNFGPIMSPLGILAFPITFIMMDTITDVFGKKKAHMVIWGGLAANVVMALGLWLSSLVPSAEVYGLHSEYAAILAGVPRITLASLVTYVVSQMLDVHVFTKIKERTGNKRLWLRNNASTMLAQVVDSVLFISIAFVGTMPLAVLGIMMASQYLIKFVATILSTPFVYLGVVWARR